MPGQCSAAPGLDAHPVATVMPNVVEGAAGQAGGPMCPQNPSAQHQGISSTSILLLWSLFTRSSTGVISLNALLL